MSVVAWTGDEHALRGDVRLDGVEIDLIVGGALASFDEQLSVTGAPVVRLGLLDPERELISSGLLDLHSDDDERLGREVELVVDGVAYWLRSVAKRLDTFELTFEDRTACRLRDARATMRASAGTVGAREFVAGLCSRALVPAPVMHEPGPDERRARRRFGGGSSSFKADGDRRERVLRREPGLVRTAGLTVKGSAIGRAQLAEANALLSVAAELDAPRVAMVALVFAGIAESSLGGATDVFTDDGHWGVLQGQPRYWPDPRDTAGLARAFLLGGKGFQGGGAIAMARRTSDPVEIAVTVEAPSIWPDNAYADQTGYDGFLGEAEAIVDAFGGGDGTSLRSGGTVTRTTEAPLTVEPDESFWDAATRIAESYRFRFFVVSNRPYFLADEALMRSEPALTIGESTTGVTLIDWEWAPRKPLRSVELECNVRAWQAPVGSVVVLDETCGPAGSDEEHPNRGRWLVGEYERSRFGDAAQVTLVKGRKPVVPTRTETISVPGTTPEQGSLDARGNITAEGGAKGMVDQAAAIALGIATDARISSGHDPSRGGTSDHNFDTALQAARDIAIAGLNPTGPSDPQIPQLNRAAVAVAAAFGLTYSEGQTINLGGDSFHYQGYRVQIFWRTTTGGNHYHHIHVGARKL